MSLKNYIKDQKILIFALIAYLLIFLFNRNIFMEAINTSWTYIREMLEVFPAVLILTGLLEVWVPRETILETFGSESGIKGKIVSFFLGSASAGPIYAGFPITQSLLRKGASVTNITIILSAWAVAKFPILLVEIQFLGLNFMLTRWALTLPAILAIGYLTGKFVDKEEILSNIGEFDEKVQEIVDVLPGHNCGSCGYENCPNYAESVAKGEARLDECEPGGEEVEEEIRKLIEKTETMS